MTNKCDTKPYKLARLYDLKPPGRGRRRNGHLPTAQAVRPVDDTYHRGIPQRPTCVQFENTPRECGGNWGGAVEGRSVRRTAPLAGCLQEIPPGNEKEPRYDRSLAVREDISGVAHSLYATYPTFDFFEP